MKTYRNLTSREIEALKQNQCLCDDWSKVLVVEGFETQYIQRVQFSGEVKLGVYNDFFTFDGGLKKHSGIFDAYLHNTEVGDNTLVDKIQGFISNYRIGDHCFIQNVNKITASSDACYGNDVVVSVLDETGARSVMLFDKMSSHVAYLQTAYRYNQPLIEQLNFIIKKYRAEQIPDKGIVEDNVRICRVGLIENVILRNYVSVEGATKLVNSTISGEKEASTHIGDNVIAEDFMVASGANIEEGVCLNRCFVGQATLLKRGYSATDSLFFSNCHLENGEACAAFAGPFTVSHHKPTLLIGTMFSFMNAGCGTNQSNHLYKLGPIHQGITERGLKTASNCYLMLPVHIGAFSFVAGKHYAHPDSSMFPFSFLLEEEGKSVLLPGYGLKNISLLRDGKKWKERDKRTSTSRLDYIISDPFSPFTAQKALVAMRKLNEVRRENHYSAELTYKGCVLKDDVVSKGIGLYELFLLRYLGDVLFRYLDGRSVSNCEELSTALDIDCQQGKNEWIDLVGLLTPKSQVDMLFAKIISREILSIEYLDKVWADLFKNYSGYELQWVVSLLKSIFGFEGVFLQEKFHDFVKLWQKASLKLNAYMLDDLKKEFNENMTVSFGLDNQQEKENDVASVRGKWDENSVAQEILQQNEQIEKTAMYWKSLPKK